MISVHIIIYVVYNYVIYCTFMHCTLPPLLGRVEKSLDFLVTGKATFDLSPMNGATMLAWAEVVLLTVETVEEEIEAIFSKFPYLLRYLGMDFYESNEWISSYCYIPFIKLFAI